MDYKITSPEGKQFKLKGWGDTPPTEDDLKTIFSGQGETGNNEGMDARTFLLKNLPASVGRTAENIAVGQVQPAANVGNVLKEPFTGGIVASMVNKIMGNKESENKGTSTPFQAAVSELVKPSAIQDVQNVQGGAVNAEKQGDEFVKNPVEYAYKNPAELAATAMIPFGLKTMLKESGAIHPSIPEAIEKAGGSFVGIQKGYEGSPDLVLFNEPTKNSTLAIKANNVTPENVRTEMNKFLDKSGQSDLKKDYIEPGTVQVSQQLSHVVPVSNQDLISMAENPDVANIATSNILSHKVDIANDAVNAVNSLPKTLKKIGSDIYQKAGIDSETTSVPIFDALAQAEADNAQSILKANTPDNIRAAKEVRQTINNAINKMDEKGAMPFGQVVEITKEMYDNAKSAEQSGDTFKQQYYENLGDKLTSAKYQIPEIKDIAPQYQELMQANDSLNKVFRLNSNRGKMTLDTKIENMFQDDKNVARMGELNNVYDALSKHPEYPELQDVKSKIQQLQLVANAEKGKATSIPFVSKIPLVGGMAKVTSGQAIPALGSIARQGLLDVQGLESRIPESKVPVVGKYITNVHAIQKGMGQSILPMTIADLIGENNKYRDKPLTSAIKNLITK